MIIISFQLVLGTCTWNDLAICENILWIYPRWLSGKEFTCQNRRCRFKENGNPLQYSCLENPMDREAWEAPVHAVTELDITEHACTKYIL